MSLLELAAEEFEQDVLHRGQEYFERGAVRITAADEQHISARVQGHDRYYVKILRDRAGRLDFRCNCGYFESTGPCKHIWATLLAADQADILDGGDWEPANSFDESDDAETPIESDEDASSTGSTNGYADDVDESSRHPAPVAEALRRLGEIQENRSAENGDESIPLPAWKRQLREMRDKVERRRELNGTVPPATPARSLRTAWPHNKRLAYVVDLDASNAQRNGVLVVELCTQTLDKSSRWGSPKRAKLTESQVASLPDADDALIARLLTGLTREAYYHRSSYDHPIDPRYVLSGIDYATVLRRMCETGRSFVRLHGGEITTTPLTWDESADAWQFWLRVRPTPDGERYAVEPLIRRGEVELAARDVMLLLPDGLMIHDNLASRLDHGGAFPILDAMRRTERPMTLAVQQGEEFVAELLTMSPLPRLDLPSELKINELAPPLRPKLAIRPPPNSVKHPDDRLIGALSFDYGGKVIGENDNSELFEPTTRTLLRRNRDAEAAARARLDSLGFKVAWGFDLRDDARRLPPNRLGRVVAELCGLGWLVEAQGKLYRQPGQFKVQVSSGIDWFELQGGIDFGDGMVATLPRLLAAVRRGEGFVQLDDGSFGVLPEEWLQKYGLLARVGGTESSDDEDALRFSRRQIGFLDALLAGMPDVSGDQIFHQAREALRQFEGVEAIDPPATFVGQLRPYQRQGIGWLQFLNEFGFGGCLADDMGLGKTVQVLAMLEARRGNGKPSLVVVPKSLVFNWVEEARRFAPALRVLDHTGAARNRSTDAFPNYDVVLTTYGTLRLDVPFVKEFEFDYAILDEAQAIKNAASESAKAARLIRANHRLALSGTPVQNHLGELWSLFEYLNPGMLGAASVFRSTGAGAGATQIERAQREVLARALRPFILRRTKEQVATDLPERTEQTIWCDMDTEQRKMYDELRDHYRTSLLREIDTNGLGQTKLQVLEALLRLRQAACHPGLIDENQVDAASAKLDVLVPQISEVIDEGHKVLVFSQFTSFLSILRRQLDAQNIVYEYLDGKTRDRQARVERFQNDPNCRLFLISLKAGGLGLNLTAAEYVYLLDPWWNPAIEAQAIDRAHRIGQTRKVFAYRLIAKDTVEQKVLELQSRKKELADMIVNADNSLITKLGREDLELLLS